MSFEEFKMTDPEHWELCQHNPHYSRQLLSMGPKRDSDIDFLETTDEERAEFFNVATKIKKTLIGLYTVEQFNYANCTKQSPPPVCADTAQIQFSKDRQQF